MDEVILDDGFGGAAAEAEDDHVLKIAQQPSQNPTARQIDIAGSHALNHLWRHSVHDVAHHRDGSDDGCGLVDERLVVARDGDSRLRARLFIEAEIIVSLGEGQEQRHEECQHHQPVGYPDACRQTADKHSHHESDGDNCHVENRELFQFDAIGDVHQPVSRHYNI